MIDHFLPQPRVVCSEAVQLIAQRPEETVAWVSKVTVHQALSSREDPRQHKIVQLDAQCLEEAVHQAVDQGVQSIKQWIKECNPSNTDGGSAIHQAVD